MSGPLTGLRVLEMEAIGPVPWAAMMLADMGATVTRVERPVAADMGLAREARYELTSRGKQGVAADLKTDAGRATVLDLVAQSDVLLEGLRPGVMERLGLGPETCLEQNPALIYGRMTGWGQTGPQAQTVGHDINYLAATGVLHAIGPAEGPPAVPLNLIGDFGAGGMLLLVGVLAALFEARTSGKGQVIDAAMVDGSLLLLAPILGRWQAGQWEDRRAANFLDGGAHFYTTYATSDGQAMAVGAIESRFYNALLEGLELDKASLPAQHDRTCWPAMRSRFADIFKQHPREYWVRRFEGTEACVSPVLSLEEATTHRHFLVRDNFLQIDQVLHPAPAPRFSRTPCAVPSSPAHRHSE